MRESRNPCCKNGTDTRVLKRKKNKKNKKKKRNPDRPQKQIKSAHGGEVVKKEIMGWTSGLPEIMEISSAH